LCVRKEYKVVLLNGKAAHLLPGAALHKVSPATKFSTYPHTDIKVFAELCVQILKAWNHDSIVHGLMRVDIMQSSKGNLVLNEFESFEANYYSCNHCEEAQVSQFLVEFWKGELNNLFGC